MKPQRHGRQLVTYREARESASGGVAENMVFQQGVDYVFPSKQKQYIVRILPSFDWELQGSEGFDLSFAPYRTDSVNEANGHADFSPWLVPIKYYHFWGPNKLSLLSPASAIGGRFNCDPGEDPFEDCRQVARRSDNPAWVALTKRDKRSESRPLEGFRYGWVFNALYAEVGTQPGQKQVWRVGLVVISDAAKQDLEKKLNEKRGVEDKILGDERWSRYMLGDVTDPVRGLNARAYFGKLNINNNDVETSLLNFTAQPDTQSGYEQTSIVDQKVSRGGSLISVLQARYVISEAVRWMDYHEMLKWLVTDTSIPRELIIEACAGYAGGVHNIPGIDPGTVKVNAPAQTQGSPAATQPALTRPSTSAPPPATTPAAPPATPAPTPKPEPKVELKVPKGKSFWNVLETPGQVTKASAEALATLFGQQDLWGKLDTVQLIDVADASNTWKPATQHGFAKIVTEVAPPPPAPPPPPPAPPPPPPAAAVSPPPPPATPPPKDPTPPAPSVPQVPPSGDLTPAEQEEFKKLAEKMASTDQANALSPEEVTRYAILFSRANPN